MACREVITASVKEDCKTEVDEYQEKRGYESRSKAVEELLQTGLRERQRPLLYRLKDKSKDWAYHMTLVAATVTVVAVASPALAIGAAIKVSVVLLAAAVTPLATVECGHLARDWLEGDL